MSLPPWHRAPVAYTTQLGSVGEARPSVVTRVAGHSRELCQDLCSGLSCAVLPVTLDQALIILSLSFLIW